MKGAERRETDMQLCLTPFKFSGGSRHSDGGGGRGWGEEGGRAFRPEIRGMLGLQKNIFGPFGP